MLGASMGWKSRGGEILGAFGALKGTKKVLENQWAQLKPRVDTEEERIIHRRGVLSQCQKRSQQKRRLASIMITWGKLEPWNPDTMELVQNPEEKGRQNNNVILANERAKCLS